MAAKAPVVTLRNVLDADLPVFFEHQRDPAANRMADFSARERDAFFAHWAKIRPDPANIIKTILCEGHVAGNIGCWPAEDKHLIGYWIGREFWNRGIATAALTAFVQEVRRRPLHAYVARHNAGSIRVLQKCGFALCNEENVAGGSGPPACDDYIYVLS